MGVAVIFLYTYITGVILTFLGLLFAMIFGRINKNDYDLLFFAKAFFWPSFVLDFIDACFAALFKFIVRKRFGEIS